MMVEDDIQHLERIILSSQHRPPLEGDQEEEGGVGGADDEVERAEAGGGEVVEGEGGDGREAFAQLPRPAEQQHRQPPKEMWLVNPRLQPQVPGTGRARRNTKTPDFLGIEKERDSPSSQKLDLSPTSAAQLLDLPSPLTERLLSPVASPGSGDSPTPPLSTRATPLATPDTSPDTSTIEPPGGLHQHTWLSEDNVLPKQDPRDVLEANRHWSIGGGETEQGTHYPMLEWTPRTKWQPPSL